MKSKRKIIKKLVIVIVIIGVVWIFSNHTTNVFEEMYYSVFPTVKSGKTYTDLENVEGMKVTPNHDIFLLFNCNIGFNTSFHIAAYSWYYRFSCIKWCFYPH